MHESSEKKSAQTSKQSIFNSLNFLDQNNLDFKEKFDVLFHTIPDGVALIQNGKIIYSNKALAGLLGYDITEMNDLDLSLIISPNYLEFVLDRYRRRNAGEDVTSNYEIELVHKDKTASIHVALSVGLISSQSEKLEFVIVRDLTEKLEIEARVQRESQLQKYFMDYLPDSIYFKDLDSKFIEANNATLLKMGLKSFDELIGKTDFDIFKDEHALKSRRDEEEIINNRISIVNKIEKEVWLNGKISWASTTKIPLIDENDEVYGTFGITRDITELKKVQDINEALFTISSAVTSLKNIYELYSTIHKTISELMRADNFYLALYHPENDTVSFPYFVDEIDDMPKQRKAARGLTEYVLRTGKAHLIDAKLDMELRKNGETSLIGEPTQIWLGVPLKVKENTIGVIVVQDYSNPLTYGEEEKEILIYVSEQIALAIDKKRNEEIVIKYSEELKESNASKDKFFSILAHDLKSPFHGLLGLSRMIVEEFDTLTDAEIKSYLLTIKESTESTYKLIENLLEWSRLESGKMKYDPALQNMFTIVEDTRILLNQVARLKNISIRNKLGHQSFIFGDDNMLQSLMQNLVSNAIKFTPNGGSIEVSEMQYDNYIEYTVSDSGVGIKSEDLIKLFRIDMSFTTKGTQQEKGTGLGLALCKEIVQLHNGKISISSVLSEGTKVSFILNRPQNF